MASLQKKKKEKQTKTKRIFWNWQIIGFALLVTGMCLYNNILNGDVVRCRRRGTSTTDGHQPLIDDADVGGEQGRPSVIH